ncbi:ABC transporter ATP-binding protein [Hoeflea prorocentri]|uniref:ABC transporter ATP-binding protein n=1 Tax=Hoeflea prorocentri TaxID=1922333 RepID=A0A9X3UNM7_9HYPH|nr:ABC transporter ATP-binding protein [Hoeflea prorocentri]MCY6383720.1 ABC transporter ATP-binding protein [Hoeflea prorocentri]MDA5401520.1 ABC transporter ATP-binding protein [Hoeflea prorocentri]
MSLLTITNLGMNFDGFQALNAVDLTLSEGEKHAIIGPNGAGKTTFFNCITRHLKPTTGSVTYWDSELTVLKPHQIVKLGIARSFQRINIYPELTVFENVQVALIADHGQIFNMIRPGASLYRDEVARMLELVSLSDDADAMAGVMSYGKQKQLELAVALASEPDLLLLDEPTAGMSPQETIDSITLIGKIAEARKLTLLFTEHDMNVVFSIADRLSVLHHGELIATGRPDEIRQNPEVRRIYLGEHADNAA